MSLSRINRSLLVFLAVSFFVSGALAQTLSLAPDPLNLQPGATGTLTLTYSQAAPVGGLSVSVSVVPGVSINPLPATITIPEGLTAVNIPITATATPGSEQVFVTAGGASDSATVVVGSTTDTSSCKQPAAAATQAARAYIKALGTVERLCRKSGGSECVAAVSQSSAALNAVNQAQAVVVANCH